MTWPRREAIQRGADRWHSEGAQETPRRGLGQVPFRSTPGVMASSTDVRRRLQMRRLKASSNFPYLTQIRAGAYNGLRIGVTMPKKELTARELASMGGRALAKKLTAKERSESARRAVLARWAKAKRRKTDKS